MRDNLHKKHTSITLQCCCLIFEFKIYSEIIGGSSYKTKLQQDQHKKTKTNKNQIIFQEKQNQK